MPAGPHNSSPAATPRASPPEADPTSPGLRALAVAGFVIAAVTFIAGFVLAAKGDSWTDGARAWSPASFLTLLAVLALMKARGPRR